MKMFLLLLVAVSHTAFCREAHWKSVDTKTDASFRGLSVVDDDVAWVSGSKGWVGVSTDGGNSWEMKQVKGFEKCDFRTLYAFNARAAVIANAGYPACILRTTDGGNSWAVVYRNNDSAAFFDGIGFWDHKEGIIYGDPIGGRMLLLHTGDGGQTWQEMPEAKRPALEKEEASFAASGTAIRCMPHHKTVIATGGKVSRLWITADKGSNWETVGTPILQGLSSTGIFSLAYFDEQHIIIVGGDYKRDALKTDHVFYTGNGGVNWYAPITPTGGYRECVEYMNKSTVIATGPGGTDISYDGGRNWQPLSAEKNLHTIRKSAKGSKAILAGSGGKICIWEQ